MVIFLKNFYVLIIHMDTELKVNNKDGDVISES